MVRPRSAGPINKHAIKDSVLKRRPISNLDKRKEGKQNLSSPRNHLSQSREDGKERKKKKRRKKTPPQKNQTNTKHKQRTFHLPRDSIDSSKETKTM